MNTQVHHLPQRHLTLKIGLLRVAPRTGEGRSLLMRIFHDLRPNLSVDTNATRSVKSK